MHDVHVASLKRALKGVPSKNPRDAHDAKDTLPLGSLHVHLPISASSCQYLSDKLLVAFHSSFQEKNNTFTHTHTTGNQAFMRSHSQNTQSQLSVSTMDL